MSKLTKGLFLSPEKAKAVHRAIKGYARDLAMAEEPRIQKPANDPVIKAVRKARREHAKTLTGKFEALLEKQAFWKRRLTIAQNKLEQVRWDIQEITEDLVYKAELPKDPP